jgi:hypothetical protein
MCSFEFRPFHWIVEVSCGFPQFLQANAGVVTRLPNDLLIPYIYQFIGQFRVNCRRFSPAQSFWFWGPRNSWPFNYVSRLRPFNRRPTTRRYIASILKASLTDPRKTTLWHIILWQYAWNLGNQLWTANRCATFKAIPTVMKNPLLHPTQQRRC